MEEGIQAGVAACLTLLCAGVALIVFFVRPKGFVWPQHFHKVGYATLPSRRPRWPRRVEDLKFHDGILGKGTFAQVRLASAGPSGPKWAVKVMRKTEMVSLKQVLNVMSMADVGLRLDHPHIVRMEAFAQDAEYVYGVLEFCCGGDLYNRTREGNVLRKDQLLSCTSQAVSALAYLHSFNIAHRNLKPEALLIDGHGNLKLGSMMFARECRSGLLRTVCGTPDYISPEVIRGRGHDCATDIWALGVLVYELFAGFVPFNGDNMMETYQKIVNGKYGFPAQASKELRDFIQRLLLTDPKKRPSIFQVQGSSFLDGGPYPAPFPEEPEAIDSLVHFSEKSLPPFDFGEAGPLEVDPFDDMDSPIGPMIVPSLFHPP